MPEIVNPKKKLQPLRRRMAKRALQLLRDQIPNSDAKKYLAGKPFLPILPTDDTVLQPALLVVITQLYAVVYPNP
jgi:hypothetical protein